MAPRPPFSQWLDTTASRAPASLACLRMTSCSLSVSLVMALMATRTFKPNDRAFSICLTKLAQPLSSNSMFSLVYSGANGTPALTSAPPPWTFKARTVATIITTSGTNPEFRVLMFKNRSPPMVKSKPASVTTYPGSWPASVPVNFNEILSAKIELAPMEMLANGPAWIITGVPSRVCMRVGLMASFNNAVSAPPAQMSSQVTGAPDREVATTMRPNLWRMSFKEVERAKIAMHSEATEISNPVFRVKPFSVGASPIVMPRKNRSLQSTTRFQVMESGSMSKRTNLAISSSVKSSGLDLSMPSFFNRMNIDGEKCLAPFLTGTSRRYNGPFFWVDSWNIRVSMAAASKLFAMEIAWMSPVKCMLNSSIGITCE